MALLRITGFVATTNPLPVYGGIALGPQTMEQIAASIRAGGYWTAHHDGRYLMKPKVIAVEVKRTDKGSLGVWVELEVDETEWMRYGEMRGFSVAVTEPYIRQRAIDVKPFIGVYADAAHFEEEVLNGVASDLGEQFSVEVGRLYQFSEMPPAKVVIELAMMTLTTIPVNLVSSFLYDTLRRWFFKPRYSKETVFHYRVRDDKGSVDFHLTTSNEAVLKDALQIFRERAISASPGQTFDFDEETRTWKAIR